MTDSEAATILAAHNRWRRADEDAQMQDPKELGTAIDVAVHAMAAIPQLRSEKRVLVGLLRECYEFLIANSEPRNGVEARRRLTLLGAIGAIGKPESGVLL